MRICIICVHIICAHDMCVSCVCDMHTYVHRVQPCALICPGLSAGRWTWTPPPRSSQPRRSSGRGGWTPCICRARSLSPADSSGHLHAQAPVVVMLFCRCVVPGCASANLSGNIQTTHDTACGIATKLKPSDAGIHFCSIYYLSTDPCFSTQDICIISHRSGSQQ